MSTEAPAKATPVAAPAVAAKPAQVAAPSQSPNQRSPEQLHAQSRTERIKAVVDAANKKKAEAAPAQPAATDTPANQSETAAKPVEKPVSSTAPVEPPTVIKAEKKVDAPVVEADPIDSWKLPDNANAQTVKDFATLRTEAKARKQRAEEAERKATELETQLATYRNAAPADTAAVETLKTQLKDAHDRLAVFDLKSHPDFVREFVTPINVALADAREVLSWNTKEGEEMPNLEALMAKPAKELNAEISKITKDMNSADANVIMNSLRNAHKLNAKQGEALSKSGELNTRLQQQAAQQSKAAFEEVSKNLGPAGDFLQPLEIVEGLSPEDKAAAEAYNGSLGTVRANAEKLAFGQVDAKGVATMSYKAATFDHMVSHTIPRVQAEFRKLATLCQQQAAVIKELRGGGTAAAELGSGGASGGHEPDLSKMSIEQRVKYRLSEAKKTKQR